MFGFFNKKIEKKEIEVLKNAVQTGFNNAKQDIYKMSAWIKHLDQKDNLLKNDISEIHDEISNIKEDLENIKNMIDLIQNTGLIKQRPTVFNKQTAVDHVLNTVQTAVQTAFLDNLSPMERAIVLVLLNSEMKLSHEDIASMLGKRKATIRGQLNAIKQKSEGLIEEIIGENNKKRVYIPEKVKEMFLKNRKVRVKNKEKKSENNENN
jgi:uncharacterized protein YjgD (DUF1641 family)